MKNHPTDFFQNLVRVFGTDDGAYISRQLGVEKQAVYRWRDGLSIPSRSTLRKISQVTGKSSVWLLGNQSKLSDGEVVPGNHTTFSRNAAMRFRLIDTDASPEDLDLLLGLYSQLPTPEDQRVIAEMLAMVRREMEWRIQQATKDV